MYYPHFTRYAVITYPKMRLYTRIQHVKLLMMPRATFRFYAGLNDLLPPDQRQDAFTLQFNGRVTIKHLVESLGVPHTEIDLIIVNGNSVDFSYLVQNEDRISVYPIFVSIDIGTIGRLRPQPLRETRFVLDTHLGQLATYLRLIGFDCLYQNNYEDADLAEISSEQRRIMLTRDRGLLKRNLVRHGYCIRENDPRLQLLEVIRRFDLHDAIHPFQRCLKCNGWLESVDKEDIVDRLQYNTSRYFDEFRICVSCDQVYWKGSHFERMQRFLDDVLNMELE
ncbi:MAG: Mut7-C RNAse domain-containing protein [Candidatus Promineifilaceae bacterium]